jgi:hypothetical protein
MTRKTSAPPSQAELARKALRMKEAAESRLDRPGLESRRAREGMQPDAHGR